MGNGSRRRIRPKAGRELSGVEQHLWAQGPQERWRRLGGWAVGALPAAQGGGRTGFSGPPRAEGRVLGVPTPGTMALLLALGGIGSGSHPQAWVPPRVGGRGPL